MEKINKNISLLKKNVFIVSICIAFIFILIFFLVHMLNLNNYKNTITEKFHVATGRDLIIKGPIELKGIFPNIHIEAKEVAITNPPEFKSGNFIYADKVDFSLKLFPLLGGALHFGQITLENLNLNFIKNKSLNNWSFAKAGKKGDEKNKIDFAVDKLNLNKTKISYADTKEQKATGFALGNATINGNLIIGGTPYRIKSNFNINELNIQNFIDKRGPVLKFESVVFAENFTAKPPKIASNLNGDGALQIGKITLYGVDIQKFNRGTQKIIDDMTIFKRLITYTHTLATVKTLKNEIDKLQGIQQKNYQDKSDLGHLAAGLIAKNGNVQVTKCKLTGPAIDGLCDGKLNLNNNNIDILLQARLLPKSTDRKNVINYIYFPLYIKGSLNNPTISLDWNTISKQITKYYDKK